jgi:hypothetical protein
VNLKVYLSETREICEDMIKKISESVSRYDIDGNMKNTLANLFIYTFAHSLDQKSFIFDEQYDYLGNPNDKIRKIIDNAIDYLLIVLSDYPFSQLHINNIESDIKTNVYDYIEQKINQKKLGKNNFSEFILLLKKNYEFKYLLKIIKKKLVLDQEKKVELYAIIEYMTFQGKNEFEESDLDNLQDALNFRLNRLKSYSFDYFISNFFIVKGQSILLSEDYNSTKYFYSDKIVKELKNLLVRWDDIIIDEKIIKKDVNKLVVEQKEELNSTQSSIDKLKKLKEKIENK